MRFLIDTLAAIGGATVVGLITAVIVGMIETFGKVR